MTTEEFKTWWNDFKVCFPDTRNWVQALGREDGQAMLNSWQRAFSDVALEDALEATARIVKGDADVIKAYEREQTAASVRRASHRIRDEKSGTAKTELDRERWRKPVGRVVVGKMAKALERVQELCKDEAVTPANATERVVVEMPDAFPEDDYYAQRRYKCLRCQDCGTLEVWTGKAAILAKQDKLTGREGGLLASLFCDCDAGDRGDAAKMKIVRFDSYNFCECPHGHTTSIENRIAFVSWLENRKPKNYDGTFDTWNNT